MTLQTQSQAEHKPILKVSMDSKLYKSNAFSRLQSFDSRGRIYIPKVIRQFFKGYRFSVMVENGKIILDPIKIEEEEE